MKFKYVGCLPIKDVDLVLFGVLTPDVVIKNGFTFEIDDNETELINRVKMNGNYEVVPQIKPKKVKTTKKVEETKKETKKEYKKEDK